MRVLFIRHAGAVESKDFDGDSMLRPITKDARQKASKTFTQYAKIFEKPDLIITSNATRCKETAELLSVAFANTTIKESELLNPISSFDDFKELVASLDYSIENIIVVGHEPNLSTIISQIVTSGQLLYINLKKCACVEVEMGKECVGELRSMISSKQARALRNNNV